MFRTLLQQILPMLKGFTTILLSIGYLIALLFFHLAVVSAVFLSLVFYLIWEIAQKGWSTLFRR